MLMFVLGTTKTCSGLLPGVVIGSTTIVVVVAAMAGVDVTSFVSDSYARVVVSTLEVVGVLAGEA